MTDPSERTAPDFHQLSVLLKPTATTLVLSAHAAWGSGSVDCYLYGAKPPQRFLVSFAGSSVSAVLKQDQHGDGHFETTIDGSVPIATNRLEKTMSLPHAGGYSGCNVQKAWCYSITSKDRIPDSGELQVDSPTCPATASVQCRAPPCSVALRSTSLEIAHLGAGIQTADVTLGAPGDFQVVVPSEKNALAAFQVTRTAADGTAVSDAPVTFILRLDAEYPGMQVLRFARGSQTGVPLPRSAFAACVPATPFCWRVTTPTSTFVVVSPARAVDVVEVDAGVTDREQLRVGVPVPVRLCRRTTKTILLSDYDGGRWTVPGDRPPTEIDVGTCTGFCLTTSVAGSKSCEAVVTEALWLQSVADPKRRRRLEVVRECGCACDRIEACPDGHFWNAWQCRCQRKVLQKPCTRGPLHRRLETGASVDVGVCRGECHWGGSIAACRALTFSTEAVAGLDYGAPVAMRIDDCGCSDCHVKPHYRLIKVDEYSVQRVNVGMCAGRACP